MRLGRLRASLAAGAARARDTAQAQVVDQDPGEATSVASKRVRLAALVDRLVAEAASKLAVAVVPLLVVRHLLAKP